jgi:hypothetical protein
VAESSYPTTGGGSVTDANYEALLGQTIPSGLIGNAFSQELVYGDSSGRQVKVRASRAAMIRGYRWQTDGAGITRAIAANASGQPRIDLAVLRLNRADWTVTFQILQGTPAASPVAPTVTQVDGPSGVWEMPLANIAVANGAATITAANVTARAVYLNSYNFEGNKAWTPTPPMNPRHFYAGDVDRHYGQTSAGWQIYAERGDVTSTTASTGWQAPVVRFTRWNGFVWFFGSFLRTGANLAADAESQLTVIPAEYRPSMNTDFALVAYAGGTAMRVYLQVSTGILTLQDYQIPFNNGGLLTIHPAIWPAQNT